RRRRAPHPSVRFESAFEQDAGGAARAAFRVLLGWGGGEDLDDPAVQIGDQIGHLAAFERRPLQAARFELLAHCRTMVPERAGECDRREALHAARQVWRLAGDAVLLVADDAVLLLENPRSR